MVVALNPPHNRWRSSQISTETVTQARLAPVSTSQAGWLGIARQTSTAKTPRPMLPIADPAASTLTAFAARCVPVIPARSFFCFSCFSIRVALAGNIAGNAKNSPPTTGPNAFAMIPADAVTSPPNKNRTAYSCHFVSARTEKLTLIFMADCHRQRYKRVKAVPNHIRMDEVVTARAFHL